MDGRTISHLPSLTNRNRVKRFTSEENIKEKKYSYSWAKYSLEDKQNPALIAEFKQKLLKYLEMVFPATNAFTDMVLG
jgi:hypothetical protein